MTGNISETVEKPKGKTKAFFEFEWTAGDAEDPRARSPSEAVTQATTGSRWRLRAAILTDRRRTAFANVYEIAADKVNVLFTQTAGDPGALPLAG